MKFKKLGDTSCKIPVIGQGTGIGGHLAKTATYGAKYTEALRLGIDLGMSLIDTAEEYGRGVAEKIVAKATKGIRDKVFIATKFPPEHNSYNYVLKSAEGSLRRLKTDYIDLYQIHWPNPKIPIEETMKAMKQLLNDGKIRHVGLCNFSLNELKQAQTALDNEKIVSTQVEYNLFDRSIERDILPFCEQKNITAIAYSPLDQGRIASGTERKEQLKAIAAKYEKTAAQVALNWLVSHQTVIAIPNATSKSHITENSSAVDFELMEEDIKKICEVFKQECVYIPTNKIRVFSGDERDSKVYQTVEDAVANKMGFVPSPLDLSRHIQKGEEIKPVRLKATNHKSKRYDFDLTEGRIRYWGWVIAHNGKAPIPAYIRQD